MNLRKLSRLSSTVSNMGSMSYLKNMPGTALSPTICDCSVTAYWLVKTVREPYVADSTEYTVGTTERKYWNLWKWLGVIEMVRSRGLRREG